MYKTIVMIVASMAAAASGTADSNFAACVISHGALVSPYDINTAVLGKPSTEILSKPNPLEPAGIFKNSLVYSPYNVAPDGSPLIVQLDFGANIVVAFDHNVGDDLHNLYGIDFIIFGNSRFRGVGTVYPVTDMNSYKLSPTSMFDAGEDPMLVSVAQYSNGPWYSFASGPYADALYPTQAYAWDVNDANWADEQNWLKPVNPAFVLNDFKGETAAAAIAMYDGSAGGTGFDLANLSPDDYAALEADPVTGRKWIRYVKVEASLEYSGEIDGFSDVESCGDWNHPYPVGDLNQDCRVNMLDYSLAAQQWIESSTAIADVVENWLECTWMCK
jgi:hypothetical protein